MLTRCRFRPGRLVTLGFAVLLPVLVGLGYWQLERAAEKAAIRDRYLARSQMDPVEVNRSSLDPREVNYRRARVLGRYREDLTIYLDNKVLNGVPGYEIVTPLEIAGPDRAGSEEDSERFILINRGWVSWGGSRQTLPAIDTPRGLVEASGRLNAPSKDYFTLGKRTGDATFKPRWQNLDLDRYEKTTELSVSPLVLELEPANVQGGGFVRHWPAYDDTWIDRHKAYALQWFALALTLVVLYVVLNLKKSKSPITPT